MTSQPGPAPRGAEGASNRLRYGVTPAARGGCAERYLGHSPLLTEAREALDRLHAR